MSRFAEGSTKGPKTFAVAVVGCRTNQYEAEALKSQLRALGYQPVQEGQTADVCLIHTCAVTKSAESSSRHEIRALVSRHAGSRVVVTGCLARKKDSGIADIEGVTDVVADENVEEIARLLFPDQPVAPFAITQFDDHTRAFIKVQDGCNHFCAYCTVPLLRGRSRSRSMAAILDEIRGLVDTGYQEIVLTGVNIGDFADGENRLGDLVRAVDAIEGIKRLRLSSINPNEIDNVLFEALVTGRTTSHALHLVLQSGSNAVLQRMRRLYTREQYLAIVDRFVQRCPDWTISTDVIVGFPGETEEDFAATLDVIRSAKHIKVHMFPYSVRPRTLAARSIDRVSPAAIKRRKHHLLEVADAVAFERRQSFVGQTMEVLVEDSGESGFVRGQTSNGLQVVLPQASVQPNTMVLVRLEQNSSCELIGTIIGSAP